MRPAGRAALLLALLPLLVSCLREGPSGRGVRFVVDESRLGAAFSYPELDLRFRPPAGWEPLPSGLVAQAAATLAGQAPTGTDTFELRPAAAFLQQETGATCLLSTLSSASVPLNVRQTMRAVRGYVQEIRKALPGARVDEGTFPVDAWSAVQPRIVEPRAVIYRLILLAPRHPSLQVDYLLPAASFQKEIVKLESSIGSPRSLSAAEK